MSGCFTKRPAQGRTYMRPNRTIAAVALIAALAVGGCSKRDQAQAKAAMPGATQPKLVATHNAPLAATDSDEEGFTPPVKPRSNTKISFSDGEAAYKARKYTDATTLFEQYIEQKPDNAWGYYMLGMSAWKAGDLSKAET